MYRLHHIFWLALWLLGIGFLLFYLVRWLSGDYFDPVRVINYVMPWLLVLLLPVTFITGLARRKWLLFTLTIPTLTISLNYLPLFLPGNQTTQSGNGLSLKVMSHNLFFRQDAQAVAKVIKREQPDILVLQELHPDLVNLALDDLTDLYPNLYVDVVNQPEQGFIQAILSRYPMRRIAAEFDKGRVQKVIIETPMGPIQVWNIHLLPPYIVSPAWHDEQAAALAKDISQIDTPLIVAGDLNATEQSVTYWLVNQYLQNAHWAAGKGFGFTFPAPPHRIRRVPFVTGPLYRIDHIFYSHHFAIYSAKTLDTPATSDHFPVTAELFLKR